jgi:malonyl-CoA decarboxylase
MKSTGVLYDILSRVTEVGRALAKGDKGGGRKGDLRALCEALLSRRGEATGLALGRELLDRYAALDEDGKLAFFRDLNTHFGVDSNRLEQALATWREERGDAAARLLHFASEPRSQEIIRHLNRAPGGVRELVAMRSDLLRAIRAAPDLKPLDADFQHLFASWFNRGFLELHQINWSTPAEILEKIIAYEAVHEINGWDDLRRRVAAPDRRLYAFFHPSLRNEPLIFVEVALTEDIAKAIGPILADKREEIDPREATTAVFYSISNCQAGLRGISFGNFLIKQVVENLQAEFREIRDFVTLSPVPGLRAWAEAEVAKGEEGLLTAPEREMVAAMDADAKDVDDTALSGIAARYLVQAKSDWGGPADPVARFHLGNGARLEGINTGADGSAAGLRNSWGVMVNYLYDLDDIEINHEAFANEGRVICSSAVRKLLKTR